MCYNVYHELETCSYYIYNEVNMRVAVIGSSGITVSDLGGFHPGEHHRNNIGRCKGCGHFGKGICPDARNKADGVPAVICSLWQSRSAETEYHYHRKRRYCACILGREIKGNKVCNWQLSQAWCGGQGVYCYGRSAEFNQIIAIIFPYRFRIQILKLIIRSWFSNTNMIWL